MCQATQELLRAAAVIQEAADRLIKAKAEARERAHRKENKYVFPLPLSESSGANGGQGAARGLGCDLRRGSRDHGGVQEPRQPGLGGPAGERCLWPCRRRRPATLQEGHRLVPGPHLCFSECRVLRIRARQERKRRCRGNAWRGRARGCQQGRRQRHHAACRGVQGALRPQQCRPEGVRSLCRTRLPPRPC